MKETLIVSFISASIAWTLAAMITGILWAAYTLTRPIPPIVIKAPPPPQMTIRIMDAPVGYCLRANWENLEELMWVKCQ